MNLAVKILQYLSDLDYTGIFPEGVSVMNPFKENLEIQNINRTFYTRYYNDDHPRFIILGINPGRLGAGATGIPFTDTKRLVEKCGLPHPGFETHEPSSVFMYDMIDQFGGAEKFYSKFYINSVFPLGFIIKLQGKKGVNFNYYDDKILQKNITPFIVEHIQNQIKICRVNEVVFCLGRGKNFQFLQKLNEEYHFFEKVIPLEHPRYIMQYKLKQKSVYIDHYIENFQNYGII